MISKNNIYLIFFISLLLHIVAVFFIKNIDFNKTIIENNNSITIDLQTSANNNIQTAPEIPSPKTEKFSHPLKNFKVKNLKNIKTPDIAKVETTYKETIPNNLTNIPANIPLTYHPISKTKYFKAKGSSATRKGNQNIKRGKIQTQSKNGNLNLINSYLSLIRKKIEKNKKYPIIARKMGIEGVTNIEFTIRKGGLISNLKILKSSGSSILDNAAINAIKLTSPFPQIPAKLKLNKITLKLSLIFKLD